MHSVRRDDRSICRRAERVTDYQKLMTRDAETRGTERAADDTDIAAHRVVAADIASTFGRCNVTASCVIKSSPELSGFKIPRQRGVYRVHARMCTRVPLNNELDAPFCICHTGYRVTNCRGTS